MDDYGQSVIHYAVRSSEMIAALAFLRAKGLKMSAIDADLNNVLHHAAEWRELEAIGKLMVFDRERYLLSPDKNGRMPSEITYQVIQAPSIYTCSIWNRLRGILETQARRRLARLRESPLHRPNLVLHGGLALDRERLGKMLALCMHSVNISQH